MNEISITQNLLGVALRHAEQAQATRIVRLNLVVGELSGVIGESVQFYWDMVSRGTLAEGAQLAFEHVPATLRCLNCDCVFPLDGRDYACPNCGQPRVVPAGGDDFRLESIEVESAAV